MNRPGQFRPGADPRRSLPRPTAAGIGATIRRTVGADAQRICDQVRALAAGGDPAAIVAAALLLGSVAAQRRRTAAGATDDDAAEYAAAENPAG